MSRFRLGVQLTWLLCPAIFKLLLGIVSMWANMRAVADLGGEPLEHRLPPDAFKKRLKKN